MSDSGHDYLGAGGPGGPGPDADKGAWRAWARAARRAARADGAARQDAAVCAGLLAWAPYVTADVIAVYLAFRDEVGLEPLIARALAAGKTVVAPRAAPLSGALTLHALSADQPRETGAFGQPEPPAVAKQVPPSAVGLAVLPGLAFDRAGRRLGYGGGYYDRLLPTLPMEAATVGATLDALVVARLPVQDHDVAVGYLATESGVLAANRGS